MDPPPGHFKLFGSFLPIQPPEMPAIANPPPPPPPVSPLVSGAKRCRSPSTTASSSDHKAKPRRKIPRKWAPVPPQPLPQQYRDSLHKIGGSNPTLIYSRTLFSSDVNKWLNRLNIPPAQVLEPFLAHGEDDFIRGKDANNAPNKLQVRVIDPGLTVRIMSLAMWNYRQDDHDAAIAKNRSWWYALRHNWMDVVNANGLVEGSAIQVWSFRINGELGFVIHKVASQQAEGSISNGGDKSVVLDGSSSSGSNKNGDDQGGDPGSSSSAVACAQ